MDAGVDAAMDAGEDAGVDAATDAGEGVPCGAPGDCSAPDVVTADCVAGRCEIVTCATGRESCDGDFATGCERDLQTDPDHCGVCAGDCGLGGACTAGECDTVIDVGIGHENLCVTRSSGAVFCAGENVRGEAGIGVTGTLAVYSPLREVMMLDDATSTSVGYALACAVRGTGGAVCMGNNAYGQVGSGSTGDLETLPDPVSGLTDVEQVSAGGQRDRGLPSVLGQEYEGFACALRTGGVVSCWGSEYGRGDGLSGDTNVPVTVSGAADVVDVSAGYEHACLVRSSGEVACWGRMGARLGAAGETADLAVPTAVAGITDAVRVDVGQVHSCAVRRGGQVVCWGDNANSELGADSTTTPASATPVAVPVIANAIDVDVGPLTSCALGSGGEVWCWGGDGSGRLGDGPAGPTTTATPVRLADLDATALAVGLHALCAIRRDGAVVCWGAEPRELGLLDFSSAWTVPTLHPEFPPTPTP
ncbi:MAG: hypothetical protein CMN31_08920 [Sandaracinus sp.]|nr:hypothetical protein [Myxococcales bacterium]MAT27748.1 hypothetical protein [Sandaracinus sp.]MBJ71449.1 hypothetical protein [Sandaracinus sp.]HJK90823.1 hypothetical protein [Polyangiaceae bacterium LLY-WYZ-15_(1-7)]